MDSDDFLEQTALEKIFDKSEEDDADICFFGATSLDLRTGEKIDTYQLRTQMLPITTPFSHKDLSGKLLGAHHIAPWNRLYRKSFIEACKFEFQALKRSNDLFFCVATIVAANRITVVNECLYVRTINSGTSLVDTMDEDPYSFYYANKKLREFFIKERLYEKFKARILKLHMDSAAHVISKLKDKDVFKEVALFLKDVYFTEFDIWDNRDLLPQGHRHLKNMIFLMETPKEEFAYITFNQESKLIENRIKISVIIPCFNAEKFLRECLDSILKQSLKDIEIICIDDGSTDTTIEILKEFKHKDKRLNYFSQDNRYAGVARNYGLEIAKGKYLSFLDSDDIFEPIMLEAMYNKSEEDSAEICIAAGGRYDLRTKKVNYRYKLQYNLLPKETPFSSVDVLKDIFKIGYTPSWNKLYKRTFVEDNNLKFQEIPRSNDVLFTQSAISIAKRITVVDGWLFHYRVGSCTSLVETMDINPLCFNDSYSALKDFLIQRGLYENDDIRRGFKKSALGSGLYALRMTKTKEAWLQIAWFIKNIYIPELKLLEIKEIIPEAHKKELTLLLEKKNEELGKHEPILRESEVSDDKDTPRLAISKDPKISVIVEPSSLVSNVRACIGSIISQTLKDIEIIFVNDLSVDDMQKVLENVDKEERRIINFPSNSKDLSTLRNEALNIAKGEYVTFINSNDLYLKFSLEHLYRKAKQNNLDDLLFEGIVFYDSVKIYHKHKNRNRYKYTKIDEDLNTGKNILGSLVKKDMLRTSPHMRLFKLSFIRDNSLTFKEGKGEVFTIKSLNLASYAMVHKEPLYLKRISTHTSSQAKYSTNDAYQAYQNFISIKNMRKELSSLNLDIKLEKIEKKKESQLRNIILNLDSEDKADGLLRNAFRFLNNNTIDKDLQTMFLLYIEKNIKSAIKYGYLQDKISFSEWFSLLRRTLNYINESIILASDLTQNNKDIMFNIKENKSILVYSIVNNLITPDFKRQDRRGRYIFGQKKEVGSGAIANLFSIILEYCDMNNLSLIIDFMYMGRFASIVSDTLKLSLSLKNNMKGSLKSVVHQAEWKNGADVFIENIYYTFNDNIFTIFAKYVEIDTGFSYSIKEISTRTKKVKYSIAINNQGYKENTLSCMTSNHTQISAIEKPFKIDENNPFGTSTLFRTPIEAEKGIDLFSVELSENESSGVTFAMNISFLTREQTAIYDTLYFSFNLNSCTEHLEAEVTQAEWKYGYKLLKGNVYYYIENNILYIGARHNGEWCGYSYKIKHITSYKRNGNYKIRNLSKEFVDSGMKDLSNNSVFVDKIVEWDK